MEYVPVSLYKYMKNMPLRKLPELEAKLIFK
jgi:hypothetical protein